MDFHALGGGRCKSKKDLLRRKKKKKTKRDAQVKTRAMAAPMKPKK
jgi:hypothetical protein